MNFKKSYQSYSQSYSWLIFLLTRFIPNTLPKYHELNDSFVYYKAPIVWPNIGMYDNWAVTCDFQQCGICDQQSLRSACAYAQSDQSLC